MGKVLKVREVGDPILEKQCNEVNIKNINGDVIDIIDFDILNKLQSENMIGGSTYKAKSTYITEKGIEKAKELVKKYNIKD